MKKVIVLIVSIVALLFLTFNLTYLNVYLPHSYPYRYCADKCQFEDQELGKGHDPLGRVEVNFEIYKNETNSSAILHRRFYRKWWQFWNWIDFLTHKRWSYPYAETDEDT